MKVTLSLVRGNGHYYRHKPTDINALIVALVWSCHGFPRDGGIGGEGKKM